MRKSSERIVFLDAGTVDYGDLSLHPLAACGILQTFKNTDPSLIAKRSRNAGIIITNKCVFDRDQLKSLPHLRLICIAATGANNVDLQAARELGIAVSNVSGYSTEIVAQCTWAFILALAGNLPQYLKAVQQGRWSRSPFFTLPSYPLRELYGKTLGILGYGRIGRRVAQIGRVMGMKVLIARIPGHVYAQTPPRVSLNQMLQRSDFVSLHAALSPATEKIMNPDTLRRMKPGACLINMARGGLVDEKALRDVLTSGHLSGAACDVLSQEPPCAAHPLLKAPNVLITPHIAWASLEARRRLIDEISLNIRAFQSKRRRNRIV